MAYDDRPDSDNPALTAQLNWRLGIPEPPRPGDGYEDIGAPPSGPAPVNRAAWQTPGGAPTAVVADSARSARADFPDASDVWRPPPSAQSTRPPTPVSSAAATTANDDAPVSYQAPRTAASLIPASAPVGVSTQDRLDFANAGGLVRQALQQQADIDNAAGMQAAGARAQASYDLAAAQNEARIARFRAQNGADMVLAGGSKSQKRAILDAANAADARVEAIRKQANAPLPQPNVVGNAVAATNAITGAQGALVGQQNAGANQADAATRQQVGAVGAAVAKQKLEQESRINQIGSILSTSKDPAERERASSTLLSLLGKDKPEEYSVMHVAGGTTLSPDGMSQIKQPDSVVIVNKRTGAREIIQTGQQGQQKQGPTPPENHILALKQDPQKYKAFFEAKYGKGSADQYLAAGQ